MNDDPEFEKLLAGALGTTQHDQTDRAIENTDLQEEVGPGHRSGYVAVVGKPNVGKSTLINQLLGEKVAIVSPKPQTTRIQQLAILTRDDVQIVFVDTPGIHKAKGELSRFMVEAAKAALAEADVVIWVTDVSKPPDQMDRHVAEYVRSAAEGNNLIHVMNKVDAQRHPGKFQANFETQRALLPDADFLTTTAIKGDNIPELLQKIIERLPEGPRFYPRDQVSDLSIRLMVGEMIREQVLHHTRQEVPHAVAVEVDEFKQRGDNLIYIGATIYTERESQKGIIVGKGGSTLKAISSAARQEAETFLQSKVFLETWVKVLPDWRRDPAALKRFGYRFYAT